MAQTSELTRKYVDFLLHSFRWVTPLRDYQCICSNFRALNGVLAKRNAPYKTVMFIQTNAGSGNAPCIFPNQSIKLFSCCSALRTAKPRTVTLPLE